MARYKFWNFSELIEAIEKHVITCVLKQIPSIIVQNILPTSTSTPEVIENKDDEDAKKKLFGSFANTKK